MMTSVSSKVIKLKMFNLGQYNLECACDGFDFLKSSTDNLKFLASENYDKQSVARINGTHC